MGESVGWQFAEALGQEVAMMSGVAGLGWEERLWGKTVKSGSITPKLSRWWLVGKFANIPCTSLKAKNSANSFTPTSGIDEEEEIAIGASQALMGSEGVWERACAASLGGGEG